MQRQRSKAEQHAAQELRRDDEEFLVRKISRKGLHRNLIVHGHMISDVQNAIRVSDIPRSLNMTAETMFSTTNGSPIAK